MSDSLTMMQRFEAVQDASADFLLRWVAESLVNETLFSDKLWGDIASGTCESDYFSPSFSKYGPRLVD